MPPMSNSKEGSALFLAGGVLLTLSGLAPHDRPTWLLETFPIFIAAPLLIATAQRFPLTPLAYRLIFLHALVLMVGAHYTYALVPIGAWLQEALDLSRNHYDRLGHFMQGFAPAVITREILLRTSPLRPGKWLFTLVAAVGLAISACYEFIEWAAAVILGQGADAFLSTQGDPWDTQWDMFLALVGALASQLLFARLHDRQLAKVTAGLG
jgi:putative membrane protein